MQDGIRFVRSFLFAHSSNGQPGAGSCCSCSRCLIPDCRCIRRRIVERGAAQERGPRRIAVQRIGRLRLLRPQIGYLLGFCRLGFGLIHPLPDIGNATLRLVNFDGRRRRRCHGGTAAIQIRIASRGRSRAGYSVRLGGHAGGSRCLGTGQAYIGIGTLLRFLLWRQHARRCFGYDPFG